MDNLLEELISYEDLVRGKDKLNRELATLSGKNDEQSIRRINEIGKVLNELNTQLSDYDKDTIDNISKYFNTEEKFSKLSNEIKEIEKLSKKSKEEKVTVLSAENRKKVIDKSFEEEYKLLVSQKNELREEFKAQYETIKKVSTARVAKPMAESSQEESAEFVLPNITNNDLNDEEKIAALEDRLERIFASSTLPNQGKKMIVNYKGERKIIPKEYFGIFRSTVIELTGLLNKVKNKENGVEVTKEEVHPESISVTQKPEEPVHPAREDYAFPSNASYSNNVNWGPLTSVELLAMHNLRSMLAEKGIELHPLVSTTFRKSHKVNLKKAFADVKRKLSVENFKKLLPKVWNIDKRTALTFAKLNGKRLDAEIAIKSGAVNFADNVSQKYNNAKSFVGEKKQAVVNVFKDTKEKAKEAITATKDAIKGAGYEVVNRVTDFKDNTCQRINSAKGKIVSTTKSIAGKIKEPFDKLRAEMHSDTTRQELAAAVAQVREANQHKQEELSGIQRVKRNPNAGYVMTGVLLVVGIIVLAVVIFTCVGNIING